MTRKDAREISEREAFTRQELHDMLAKALKTLPESFWTKASPNKSFDNGFYFNLVLSWVNHTEETKDEVVSPITAFRVLHRFGEMSPRYPFGLIFKSKKSTTPLHSEAPSLVLKEKYKKDLDK